MEIKLKMLTSILSKILRHRCHGQVCRDRRLIVHSSVRSFVRPFDRSIQIPLKESLRSAMPISPTDIMRHFSLCHGHRYHQLNNFRSLQASHYRPLSFISHCQWAQLAVLTGHSNAWQTINGTNVVHMLSHRSVNDFPKTFVIAVIGR